MKRSPLFAPKPLTHAVMLVTVALSQPLLADDDVKKDAATPDAVIRIDPVLEKMATTQVNLPAVIVFGAQPQRDVAKKIRAAHVADIDALAAQVRAIYQRYLPKESIAGKDQEIEHGKLLLQYMSDADKEQIRKLNVTRETLVRRMRSEIARASEQAVAASHKDMVARLQSMGVKIGQRLITLNAVSAHIPAGVLKDVASLQGVAEVVYDQPGKPELDNQVSSLGADGFWNAGYDGGVWDVGVLDGGVLETHTALSGHRFFENYASHDSHGTGVACMYASTDTVYRGLAFGLDAILVDDAGSTATSMAGADWMVRSAGDDPEVINYSWGNGDATGEDWHAFSRFVDALVYDYSTSWAKSAGNQGFGTNTMTVPANNFNGLTVANMNDANTVTRSDDVITASSSRGPTVLNRKKPDLSAPGHNTMTCNAAGGYSNLGGTSSAAPKVGAGSLLLTDAGNWDPKAIKAVLINTADSWEDNDTQTTADDGAKTGKEWNKTYGWGYLDLWHASFHRHDYFVGSVKPKGQPGSYKLYKGQVYNGDKATLVWERDVDYNNAATPTHFRTLSDLDLKLYNETTNVQVDSDVTVRDNVHQVAATARMPAVVKVYAYSTSFDGAVSESFALATEENFSAAVGPVLVPTLGAPVSVSSYGQFTVSAQVRNNGDLDAHGTTATLVLPAGFTLMSGAATQAVGVLADGAARTVSWTVRAPLVLPLFSRSYSLGVTVQSMSYGERFSGSGMRTISVL